MGPVPVATGTVEVVVLDGRATLLVNGVPSSCLDPDPLLLEFEYHQQMAAVVDGLPDGQLRAVHLGAGACTFPRWLHARRPGSRQLAVDVDPDLVRLVREWFDLPRSPHLRLRAAEARATLDALPAGAADVLVRDVFAGDETPRPLTTVEAAAAARRALAPGGLYVLNCADRPPLAVARAEVAALLTAFDDVLVAAEPGVQRGRRYGNLVLVAGSLADAAPGGYDLRALDRRLRTLPVPAALLDPAEARAFATTARHDPAPEPAA